MVDLMFRDESNHVIQKANTLRNRIKKNKHSGQGGATTSTSKPVPPPHPSLPLPGALLTFRDGFRHRKTSVPSKGTSPLLTTMLIGSQHSRSRSGGNWSLLDEDQDDDDDGYERIFHNGDADDDALILVPYTPSISLQERGTAFFFSRYVATDHGCYQNYDFIYDIWRPPRSTCTSLEVPGLKAADACITASMTAVGLAGLSKITCCRETMIRAQKCYGTALQLANAALRDPNEAVKDSTMLGVLILGTYEFISGRTPQTLRAWQEHVNGAAALASMRGKGQFRTKTGVRMFLMLSHSILISCIQSGLPMPLAIVDLRDELRHVADIKRPAWRVIDPLYRALQIRHDIKHRRITGVDEIVDSLAEVESDFEELIAGLPPSWRYRHVQLARSNSAVLGRTCHVYPGLTQATSWNAVRTMRILVQETILEQLCNSVDDPTTLPIRHQIHLVKAMRLLRMLGEAVVGSVPQHFGIVSSRDVKTISRRDIPPTITAQNQPSRILSTPLLPPVGQEYGKSTLSTRPSGSVAERPTLLDPTQSELNSGRDCDAERFLTLATASNTIIWPLYTLGLSSSCTHETRAYIVDRLNAIYNETGLEQARGVAEMMQGKVESLSWASIPTTRLPSLPDEALPAMV